MASEQAVTPEEYRGDVKSRVFPGRLPEVDSLTAMIAIFVVVMIGFSWKRMRGTVPFPPTGKTAVAQST